MNDFASTLSKLMCEQAPNIDWGSLDELPDDPRQGSELRRQVSRFLIAKFIERLPPDKVTRFLALNWDDGERKTFTQGLDKFIIEVAESIGMRVLLWDVAHERVLWWGDGISIDGDLDTGLELLQKFCNVILRRARVARGKDKGRVHSFYGSMKAPFVLEIKRFADLYKTSKGIGAGIDLGKTVRDNPRAFPTLNANLTSIESFAFFKPSDWDAFLSGLTTATVLFRQWGAWSLNLDEETFRQRLTPAEKTTPKK